MTTTRIDVFTGLDDSAQRVAAVGRAIPAVAGGIGYHCCCDGFPARDCGWRYADLQSEAFDTFGKFLPTAVQTPARFGHLM